MTISEARDVRRRLRELASRHSGRPDVLIGGWVGDAEQEAAERASILPAGRRDMYAASARPIEHRTGRCWASPVLAVVTADGDLYGCCNLRALSDWSFGRLDYAAGIGFTELWEGSGRRQALKRMHCTECIRHCTHPLSRYNEMIEVLRDAERLHSEFV